MDISDNSMYVVKRNGEREEVSFDKILKRIKYLSGCLGCPLSELTVNQIHNIESKPIDSSVNYPKPMVNHRDEFARSKLMFR